MKAVILAGGLGTRLRPVTYEIPKPLLPVKKKPIINHLLELFARHGISEVAVLASRNHQSDFERWHKTWFEGSMPQKVSIFFEDAPRGTFGGLHVLKEWLGGKPFVLSNGDELKDFNVSALAAFHRAHAPVGTVALVEVANPREYGVPLMNGHHIREFLEKPENPPTNFISSGLYALDPSIFDFADFSKAVVMIERDVFPKVAAQGKLMGFKVVGGRWYDCGNLERWEKAIKEW